MHFIQVPRHQIASNECVQVLSVNYNLPKQSQDDSEGKNISYTSIIACFLETIQTCKYRHTHNVLYYEIIIWLIEMVQ